MSALVGPNTSFCRQPQPHPCHKLVLILYNVGVQLGYFPVTAPVSELFSGDLPQAITFTHKAYFAPLGELGGAGSMSFANRFDLDKPRPGKHTRSFRAVRLGIGWRWYDEFLPDVNFIG